MRKQMPKQTPEKRKTGDKIIRGNNQANSAEAAEN
jgi:hypothetical protein